MNKAFRTIGGGENISFRMSKANLVFGFFTMLSACLRLAHLLKSCFIRPFAEIIRSQFFDVFRRELPTKIRVRLGKPGKAQLFAGFSRVFQAQARTGNRSNVETLVAKWFELLKPVLLTSGQGHRQYQFQYFEGERLFTR